MRLAQLRRGSKTAHGNKLRAARGAFAAAAQQFAILRIDERAPRRCSIVSALLSCFFDRQCTNGFSPTKNLLSGSTTPKITLYLSTYSTKAEKVYPMKVRQKISYLGALVFDSIPKVKLWVHLWYIFMWGIKDPF